MENKKSFFTQTYNDTFGYDSAVLFINEYQLLGIFDNSPLEQRLILDFNYVPVNDSSKKPYKAVWMIEEFKLYLTFVNGIINNKRLFTIDITPEFPNDDIRYFYSPYSGVVKFIITDDYQKKDLKKDLGILRNEIILKIEHGNVIEINGKRI